MKKKEPFSRKISRAFQEDAPLMRGVSRLLNLAVLNLAVLLCSLPLVTAGCGLTALYTVLEQGEQSFDAAFLKFFREAGAAFRRSLLPWLMVLLSAVGVGCAWYLALVLGKTDQFLLMLPLFLATALLLLLLVWLFPVLAADRELRGTAALRQGLLLGLKELPRTLLALIPELALLVLPLFCTTLTRVGLYLFFGAAPLCALKARLLRRALYP